ncbi:T9SS type A sorting domain-containing protein [Schleiferia thermophila]|uniref:T9SS type A sorting domain-containing protein n=1 Tax=Schleiferia thermophila TaxID=884107 RepID=UPI00056B4994|nr:T9SS type A sorting domain-containing protein [Schleiferia thermophila]
MNTKFYCWLIFLSSIFSLSMAQIKRSIGINISSVEDYSTELVFTDAFKQSRSWISSNADGTGPWNTGVNVPLNVSGYPLQIPYNDGSNPPQIVKTLMLWDIGNAVPTGHYRLKVSGNGQVRLSFGASGTYNCPVDTLVNVTGGGIMLEILSSSVSSPISDIKFIYPDYVNTYEVQKYTNEFLDFLKDFQVIRFMDFTKTNGSAVAQWTDRTPANYYTQAKSTGASWESVIEIANLTKKDIWINIPHKANDLYIYQLATLLHSNLDSSIKVYLEYSNEVWNAAFPQHAECAQMAQSLGYTGPEWERAWKYTVKRSADVFKIFEDVFDNDSRLIKIIPTQATTNGWLSEQLISYFNNPLYNPHGVSANTLSIAPYFAGNVADQIVSDGVVNSITTAEIITRMQNSLTEAFSAMIAHKTVANYHGLDLICYEGGQHLVATGGNITNNTLTNKLISENLHPLMQDLYCQYFNFWYDTIGTLFCHYSSHSTYTQWGSWGIKINFQDINNPKYLGLKNCVFNHNISTREFTENSIISIYPNPSNGNFFLQLKEPEKAHIKIFDLTGRLVFQKLFTSHSILPIEFTSTGTYIINIQTKKINKTSKIIIQ